MNGGRGRRVSGKDPYAIIPAMFPPLRHIFLQGAGVRRAAALNFLIVRSGLLICALFALTGLALAGDYGMELDSPQQRRNAQANLNYILGQADHVATPVYLDRVFGMAFELPLLLTERALGFTDNYHIGRLRSSLTHLFFILGGYFCYRLAYRLFGNRLIALLALLFFLLHPRLYAHSYLNTKDLPFLSMFAIALYLLERAFRRDTAGAFVLLGIAVGLLTNLRIMGVVLFPAVIAMRGLDLFHAEGRSERKKILLTAGLFAAAAGLTLYAATPYAWANPVDYLAASLDLTVNHPNVVSVLFQGERMLSDQLPPHYGVVWFGITTSPPILLLGVMGMAAAMAGFGRRPGAVFRNGRWRFALLLPACFLLPPLAAAALGSNQFGDWRHSYFLYVPFSLLAAGGLYWLAAGLSRRRFGRVGVYGLAGLGLGLIALQLAQLHPVQYNYFSFLVDRTTPEYLRTRYQLDYWQLAAKAALADLLERHPDETLTVRAEGRHRDILPPESRRRLLPAAGRHADYDLTYHRDASQPDLAFNGEYRRSIYNNTLVVVRPLDAARMTPAAVAAYGEIYREAVAGEPIIRADYNVYRNGNRLTFVKENCPAAAPDAWFSARLFPHRLETLPPHLRRRGSYARFGNSGVRLGDTCLAVIQLPDYAQGDIILTRRSFGDFRPQGRPLWSALYSLSRTGLGELIAEHRRKQPAAGPKDFEVFRDRAAGRNRMLYAKRDCTDAEYETRVTLHIYPVNLADLPARHRGSNFDNRDFTIDDYGGRPGGECVAVVPLPDYPIQAIRTGQDNRWEVNLYPPPEPDYLRAAYAALSDILPNVRADFDLYWREGRLVYLRETCQAADTAANFFLHIIPVDAAVLPADRQAAGFANLDFPLARWGGPFDGKCIATVPLPGYPIKAIRTGQHIPGQGELWAAELVGGR